MTSISEPTAIHHVRLTVTEIARSKSFYSTLLGTEPAADFSNETDAADDPKRLYGGCVFPLGDQLLGLRPVAGDGDTFDSTRVGLDHISLRVGTVAELQQARERLDAAGVQHGEVTDLGADMGIQILSLQDPDDINLELSAPRD